MVLRHFLTTLRAVAIFELVMAASLRLPNSAHENLHLTKSVSDTELGPVADHVTELRFSQRTSANYLMLTDRNIGGLGARDLK